MFLEAHSSDYPEMRRTINQEYWARVAVTRQTPGHKGSVGQRDGGTFCIRKISSTFTAHDKLGSDTWQGLQNPRNCAEHSSGSQQGQHGWLQGPVLDPQPQSCTLSFPERKLNAYLFFRGLAKLNMIFCITASYRLIIHMVISDRSTSSNSFFHPFTLTHLILG